MHGLTRDISAWSSRIPFRGLPRDCQCLLLICFLLERIPFNGLLGDCSAWSSEFHFVPVGRLLMIVPHLFPFNEDSTSWATWTEILLPGPHLFLFSTFFRKDSFSLSTRGCKCLVLKDSWRLKCLLLICSCF